MKKLKCYTLPRGTLAIPIDVTTQTAGLATLTIAASAVVQYFLVASAIVSVFVIEENGDTETRDLVFRYCSMVVPDEVLPEKSKLIACVPGDDWSDWRELFIYWESTPE